MTQPTPSSFDPTKVTVKEAAALLAEKAVSRRDRTKTALDLSGVKNWLTNKAAPAVSQTWAGLDPAAKDSLIGAGAGGLAGAGLGMRSDSNGNRHPISGALQGAIGGGAIGAGVGLGQEFYNNMQPGGSQDAGFMKNVGGGADQPIHNPTDPTHTLPAHQVETIQEGNSAQQGIDGFMPKWTRPLYDTDVNLPVLGRTNVSTWLPWAGKAVGKMRDKALSSPLTEGSKNYAPEKITDLKFTRDALRKTDPSAYATPSETPNFNQMAQMHDADLAQELKGIRAGSGAGAGTLKDPDALREFMGNHLKTLQEQGKTPMISGTEAVSGKLKGLWNKIRGNGETVPDEFSSISTERPWWWSGGDAAEALNLKRGLGSGVLPVAINAVQYALHHPNLDDDLKREYFKATQNVAPQDIQWSQAPSGQ